MLIDDNDITRFLNALEFSANKHRKQKRKDREDTPYINHPIKVANLLWNEGHVRNIDIIIAGILHDTVEDTEISLEDVEREFGKPVVGLVNLKTGQRVRLLRSEPTNAPGTSKLYFEAGPRGYWLKKLS